VIRHVLSLLRIKEEPASQQGSSSYEQKDENMWLFVGLGNPGQKYIKTRHNIGFMAIDAMIENNPVFSPLKSKFQGKISEGRLSGQKVILLKPETYMNDSGQSVGKCAQFYKISPENIVVLHC